MSGSAAKTVAARRMRRLAACALVPCLAAALLVAGCSASPASPSPAPPSPMPRSPAAAVDQERAGQIARDYFATAHGTGVTLTDVRETDNGITDGTACGARWEVLMEGTVTESTGASYGSVMYLCVDPATGAVTRGPAG